MFVKSKLRVAVLEDESLMRTLIRRVLEKDYTVVLAENGSDLCDLVQKNAIHVVVLDIGLPGEDGISIAKRIRATSSIPVIFLSGNTSEETIVAGLNVGADDYVTKPFQPAILLARVRNALRRGGGAGDDDAARGGEVRVGNCVLDSVRRELRSDDARTCDLTETESLLLATLAHAAPKTVSREDLSRSLYGQDWNPLNRSLDVHMSHVRRKLARASSDSVRIYCIRGVGYYLQADK